MVRAVRAAAALYGATHKSWTVLPDRTVFLEVPSGVDPHTTLHNIATVLRLPVADVVRHLKIVRPNAGRLGTSLQASLAGAELLVRALPAASNQRLAAYCRAVGLRNERRVYGASAACAPALAALR